MKKTISFILIIATIGLTTYFVMPKKAQADWLSTYLYRQKITISSAPVSGTDYQVRLSIGASAGGDFNLGGKADDFPNDIAFTDNDETTELSYWIATSTDPLDVYVKVTDDLTSNVDIYIYYGKSGDTDSSNGVNTFLFFDDFNDASIDAGKWTKDIELGTITEADGYLRAGGGVTSAPYGHTSLGSKVGFNAFQDNALIYRSRVSANGIGEVAFRGATTTNVGYKVRHDARAGANGNAFLEPPYSGWNFSNGSGTCGSDSVIPTVDTWYMYEITASTTVYTLYKDGAQMRQCTDSTATAAGEIALQNHYGDHMDTDWVAVKKFVQNEPAFSSAGAEEEPPAAESETSKMVVVNNGKIIINNGKLKIIGGV